MISVIIPTLNSQDALLRCFDSLIGATVHGLVRDVIVADGGSSDATLAIADGAGAHVVQAPASRGAQLFEGAKVARSEWLLFLHPDTALEVTWETEAASFIERSTLERPFAAAFRFGLDEFGAGARRAEFLSSLRCWLFASPSGSQGLLIPRRFYQKLGGHQTIAMEDIDLARRIGRGRLVMLHARAVNKTEPRGQGMGLRELLLLCLHALHLPAGVLTRLVG